MSIDPTVVTGSSGSSTTWRPSRRFVAAVIRRVVQEAEPLRAAIFEVGGRVFQKAIDYPDVELLFYDLRCSCRAVHEAHEIASSIQRTVMSFTGPLFAFALFQTRGDELYLFGCFHHIVLDGSGIALIGHRIASVYSAIVSGARIPPAFFGSLSDLVNCESEYEASNDYLEDRDYWTSNLPSETDRIIGSPRGLTSMIHIGLLRRFDWTLKSFAEFKAYPTRGTCFDHRSSLRPAHFWCVGGARTAQK